MPFISWLSAHFTLISSCVLSPPGGSTWYPHRNSQPPANKPRLPGAPAPLSTLIAGFGGCTGQEESKGRGLTSTVLTAPLHGLLSASAGDTFSALFPPLSISRDPKKQKPPSQTLELNRNGVPRLGEDKEKWQWLGRKGVYLGSPI